ncbi:MAG: glycosyltransferase family 39 protein, partial [Thermodesulfobacteriota bacterium]|nr:glycosyltransferase family 39 protein [Thermodesulfobacteriota bacterium]
FVDFSWLNNIGHRHLNYYLPLYLRYVSFIKPLFITAGSFLFISLLFKNQIIALYETNVIKPELGLTIFLIVIFVILVLVAYLPFHNYPYSMDEYNYLYQAKIFSEGKLFLEVPEIYQPFKEMYMILMDNKLFSKYPPGFPLILSLGVLLNISGVINPFIAAITLVIIFYFVRSFIRTKYAMLTVGLLATTPYFIAHSASYFAHPTALLMTSLIFLLVRRYEITPKDSCLPLVGLCSGYFFLTRPLDAFCTIVPAYLYLAYILHKRRNLNKIIYSISTFTVVFILFLIYNYVLTGKISIATYPIVTREFRIVDPSSAGFVSNLISISNCYINTAVQYLPTLLVTYLLVPCALFMPLFALFGIFKFKSKWKWVLLSNCLLLILLYNFHPGLGWPQYGARYYYSGLFSMATLSVFAFKHVIELLKNKEVIFQLFVLVFCTHLVFSVTAIWQYSYRFKIQLAVREDIIKNCPPKSILLLNPGACNRSNSTYLRIAGPFVPLVDAKRNPFMETSRLIDVNDERSHKPILRIDEIRSHFPDHSVCYYNYDILKTSE